MWPLPIGTSSSAALPARYFSPSSQPEARTSFDGYRATTYSGGASQAGLCSLHKVRSGGHAVSQRTPGVERHVQQRSGRIKILRASTPLQDVGRLDAKILRAVIGSVVQQDQRSALLARTLSARPCLFRRSRRCIQAASVPARWPTICPRDASGMMIESKRGSQIARLNIRVQEGCIAAAEIVENRAASSLRPCSRHSFCTVRRARAEFPCGRWRLKGRSRPSPYPARPICPTSRSSRLPARSSRRRPPVLPPGADGPA